jgi:predicted dehydrogenase
MLNVSIIGTGRVARGFIRDLKAWAVPLSGFVSASSGRLAAFSRETGLPGYTSLNDLLSAHPETNVALVVNANHQHYASTMEALAKGLHVLCEKPMAVTMQECEEMARASEVSTGSLQINFEYIQSKMPLRLLQLVAEGFFGEILSASCTDSRGHWWSDAPNSDPASQTRLRRELGGGIVFHCGVHQLDLLRTFFGGFSRVQAYRSKRNSLPFYPADVPDHVFIALETPDGRTASLEILHNRAPCWYRRYPAIPVDWAAIPGHEFRLSLMGTRASCLADFYGAKLHLFRFDHLNKDTVLERTEDFSADPQNELHHDMTGFLKRYLEDIAAGRGPLVPISSALETMRLAFAVERSIAQGGAITLSTIVASAVKPENQLCSLAI